MDYDQAIAKFREIYRPTTRETVLRESEQDNGTLGIYVHNPFCISICQYCYYRGGKFDPHCDSELYERYYGDYLLRVIEPFYRSLLRVMSSAISSVAEPLPW